LSRQRGRFFLSSVPTGLAALDGALGGDAALRGYAMEVYDAARRGFKDQIQALSHALADLLRPPDELKEVLDALLDQEVIRHTQRPNTAAQVRLGQAARLARWLQQGGRDWPLVLLDEPTLAQDEASCARTLARVLRLARKVELWRTAAFLAMTTEGWDPSTLVALHATGTEYNLEWIAPETAEATGGRVPLPAPAQVVVLSFQEQALAVVADQEGVVLDHKVRAALQGLVPRTWWGLLAEQLRKLADGKGDVRTSLV